MKVKTRIARLMMEADYDQETLIKGRDTIKLRLDRGKGVYRVDRSDTGSGEIPVSAFRDYLANLKREGWRLV